MSLFEDRAKNSIKIIKDSLMTKDVNSKKILSQFPDLNLTSAIEKELYFKEKLKEALSNPEEYFTEKQNKLKTLGINVNNEFVIAFNELKDFTDNVEAKRLVLEKAKTYFNIEMHKIQQIFPPKIDLDLENKLLMDLRNKLANPKYELSGNINVGPIEAIKEEQI